MAHTQGIAESGTAPALAGVADVVLRNSPDVVTVVDGGGVVRDVSGAVTRVLHVAPDALIGTNVTDSEVVHPDDRETVAAVYRRLLAGAIDRDESRHRVRTRDGSFHTVEAHRELLRAPDGSVEGIVVVERDVSAQVRLEEELRVAREDAEHADHVNDEFLSRMSHELRTPLNAVIGFGRLLARDDLTADQQDCVAQILKGGELLLDVVTEVLDIARAASGRIALSAESVPLADAIETAVTLVEPIATGRDVRVSTAGDRSLHAQVDRERLSQILSKLLSNAVKYNKPGGSIDVAYAAVSDSMVRVQVCDTGIGLSPDALGRMFTPFDRLGAERTEIEGNGLGLVVVKSLVESMGGAIDVESTEGVGSTFTVTFPVGGRDPLLVAAAGGGPARPQPARHRR